MTIIFRHDMRNKRWFLFIFMSFLCISAVHSQLKEALLNALTNNDTAETIQLPSVDSIKMEEMEKALVESRLTEMNLRLEMEALKKASFIEDSIQRVQQRIRIDSLRSITPGIPVVVESDTLYYIYSKRGGVSPQVRARIVEATITSLGKRYTLQPDSLYIEETDITTEIMYEDKVVASFTDQDALWENMTRSELANLRRLIIINKMYELQKEYGFMQLIKRILLFLLVLTIQGLLIWFTFWFYKRAKFKIARLKQSKLKPVFYHNYEIFDTRKQVQLLLFLAKLLYYAIVLIQLIVSIPILFSIFPQTEDLAYKIFSYIWNPVKDIFAGVINYMPNLFTIIIIWLAIKYLVRGVGYFAGEIESEKLKISGFYPDWAQPSFQIIRFLLYAFMIAMIYPYLPGSNTGIFQGISVFVGLIISLGSTTVIGNIMAGLVITYMRPFKIGDRIKLNETVGNVIEKTAFVTRIRTPKNEIVTIPNSFILSSHTINYSASAKEQGLIIHSEISFGFEEHWEKVHNLLIDAALATPGVLEKPKPFVHEISLQDFYPIYQINAYIEDADKQAQIYSDLHANIQDLAGKAGIELLSPHYYAARDGSMITIPKEYKKT